MHTFRKLPTTRAERRGERELQRGRQLDDHDGGRCCTACRALRAAATATIAGDSRTRPSGVELVRRTGRIERHARAAVRARRARPSRRRTLAVARAKASTRVCSSSISIERAAAAAADAPRCCRSQSFSADCRIGFPHRARRSSIAALGQRRRGQRRQPPRRPGTSAGLSNHCGGGTKIVAVPVVHEPDVLHVLPLIGSCASIPFRGSFDRQIRAAGAARIGLGEKNRAEPVCDR